MWSRRAQEYEAKINSGDLVTIAEVVRDLYRSDTQPEQSYSERQLYEAALDRMAREVAAVRKLIDSEALKLIESFLPEGPASWQKTEADAADEDEVDVTKAAWTAPLTKRARRLSHEKQKAVLPEGFFIRFTPSARLHPARRRPSGGTAPSQLGQRATFDLADALLRNAELVAERFQRHEILGQAPLLHDAQFALGEHWRAHLAASARGDRSRAMLDHLVRQGRIVDEEIHPLRRAGRIVVDATARSATRRSRQREFIISTSARETPSVWRSSESVAGRRAPDSAQCEPRAQTAEIEEKRLLRGAGAAAHDRPVAQHIILDRGAYPPGRVGGEAHVALGREARRGLQQADMPFLHQIGDRQAVMTKARGRWR